jgi:TolB protein
MLTLTLRLLSLCTLLVAVVMSLAAGGPGRALAYLKDEPMPGRRVAHRPYALDLTRGMIQRLAADPITMPYFGFHYTAWSPDQRTIAYAYEVFGIYLASTTGTTLYHLPGTELVAQQPVWSPDGRYIAYGARRPVGGEAVFLMVVEVSSGAVRRIADGLKLFQPILWSGDSHLLYFVDIEQRMWSVATDGSSPARLLAQAVYAPALSPDGASIVYASPEGGDFDLYHLDTDSSQLHALTDTPSFDSLPLWSTDGEWIAFISDRDAVRRLYVMKPDGTEAHPVYPAGGTQGMAMWSPEGAALLFGAYEDDHWVSYVAEVERALIRPAGFNFLTGFAPVWMG